MMWPRLLWVLVPLLLAGVAACGTSAPAPQGAGKAASVSLSLTTVPTVRSVTVSPATASFADCRGGSRGQNTRSTPGKLGFPNGTCQVGAPNGPYPVIVTNTGIASDIDISASSASPADGGTGWALCNSGANPAVACTGSGGEPGLDQYQLRNFSTYSTPRTVRASPGLTGTPGCDHQFGPAGSCWAREHMWQAEGFLLTGPAQPSDTSTKWTVTVTWMPVPGRAG